jgi:hypothetical protein
MEQWEHLVLTLKADAKQQKDFLQSNWPDQFFPNYAPQALIPELDAIGRQGWELVSAQPVFIGGNGDITYDQPATMGYWTHEYLCFFKRRKQVG